VGVLAILMAAAVTYRAFAAAVSAEIQGSANGHTHPLTGILQASCEHRLQGMARLPGNRRYCTRYYTNVNYPKLAIFGARTQFFVLPRAPERSLV